MGLALSCSLRVALIVGCAWLGTLAFGGEAWAQPADPSPQSTGEAPAQPVVVPPELVRFEEATYPQQALERGLEAEVLLALVVALDGSVSSVEVVTPAGHGFDEAAAEAAKRFVFTPARRDGTPVAVKIQYVYRFTAPLVETPAEEQAAPTTGELEGTVLIAGAEVPLAGALISIEATSVGGGSAAASAPPALEVRTDAEGRWSFVELPPGAYRVRIAADGFASVEAQEDVVAGEATNITYRISEPVEGIEVVVTGERPPREVTRRTLSRREISRVPGTGGDALRSLQSLPGVARPPGLAGLLLVRGSSPQDTNVFIDGALVPLVYHFGGLSSVVPTELLDKIDFYPGNFSAKYGRVMGGIVDVGLRSPDTTCTDRLGAPTGEEDCFHGLAQVDLIDARALLQGPIGKDWSFAVAGRRSWLDAWLKPALEAAGAGVSTAPVYFDYQLILEHRPTPNRKFRTQIYGSDDALKILINNPLAQEPGFGGQLAFSTAFWRVQSIYEQTLSPDWDLYTTVAVGRDVGRFSIGQVAFMFNAYPIEWRSELSWKLAPGFKLNGGLDFLAVPVEFLVRAPPPPRPGEPAPGPFTTRPLLETTGDVIAFRPAWYLEGEVQPTDRLLLVPGIRLDFARDTGHADVDPRFNARYTLFGASGDGADPSRKTTLKGGVGVYSQAPQFQETDPVFGTPRIESNRSIHYSVGFEQELSDNIDVSVDGYYKDLFNQVSRAPSESVGRFVYDNAGTGAVIGAETLIKYKADERFFGWLAYTLSRSTRRNRPDEESYLFRFDQTHILTMLGSYRLGNGWEAGARFRLISGNMVTPVAGYLPGLFADDAGAYAPIEGKQFSRRLPLFHQIDVRVEKNWTFEAWRLMAYLDVWNAYNNPAVEDDLYNFDFSKRASLTGIPIVPSLGLRGEF